MSEEFGRVRELCAAFGTDLGVVLLASITWGEDKERVWVMRFCWVTEALKNGQPRDRGLGWEDKITGRSCMKLASAHTGRDPRGSPDTQQKEEGDRARTLGASSVTPPPPLAQEEWEWM